MRRLVPATATATGRLRSRSWYVACASRSGKPLSVNAPRSTSTATAAVRYAELIRAVRAGARGVRRGYPDPDRYAGSDGDADAGLLWLTARVDPLEECDDGNGTDGDGCSADVRARAGR